MLTDARAQLRGGDPHAAMATLERLQARFPKGVLLQEREVLTIQVLSALGDNAAASRKARAFLEAYPNSPHAPQLRRFTGD
jgi:outer membrane protein assembly factor BamD (BamD/ComL family)